MSSVKILKRFNVETSVGIVHLVAFEKRNHRETVMNLLSEVSGQSLTVSDIVQCEAHPRPEIPNIDFDANWTHSKDICVLAYGEKGTKTGTDSGVIIGVDFEVHRANRIRIADHFFSTEEAAYLRSLDPVLAQVEFFRLWCRKEALFKCVGGSFFESSIRRSVLDASVKVDSHQVCFFDFDGALELNLDFAASLCIAICCK